MKMKMNITKTEFIIPLKNSIGTFNDIAIKENNIRDIVVNIPTYISKLLIIKFILNLWSLILFRLFILII